MQFQCYHRIDAEHHGAEAGPRKEKEVPETLYQDADLLVGTHPNSSLDQRLPQMRDAIAQSRHRIGNGSLRRQEQ